MPPMKSSENAIIIVGGGPVGLTIALKLGQAGLHVKLFERGDIMHQEPRASTLHAATLDMLDELGVYKAIEPLSIVCPVMRYWDRKSGKLVAEFDHAVLSHEIRHPWALQCEQDKLSRALFAMVSEYDNIEIFTRATVVACSQTDEGVEVSVRDEGGAERRVSGSYLIGADGARSTVRELADIAFEGFTYPERFVIISTSYDFMEEGGFAYRNYILDPDDWAALFKIAWNGPPGVWRMVTPARADETAEILSKEDTAQSRLQKFRPLAGGYDIPFFKWYSVDQRVAARFRKGRIVLAGDAAHLNNPLGAMGLNSGLHDGFNLSERLIAIAKRGASSDLLDQYERQRRHVAVVHVQAATMADKQNMEHRDAGKRREYLDNLRKRASDPVLAKDYLMKASLIESLRDAALIQ
jgi:3-(3-hydroxy-phenyl)propionate hydroxylase